MESEGEKLPGHQEQSYSQKNGMSWWLHSSAQQEAQRLPTWWISQYHSIGKSLCFFPPKGSFWIVSQDVWSGYNLVNVPQSVESTREAKQRRDWKQSGRDEPHFQPIHYYTHHLFLPALQGTMLLPKCKKVSLWVWELKQVRGKGT